MRRRLVVAWLVGLSTAVSCAGESPSRPLTTVEIPSVLRPRFTLFPKRSTRSAQQRSSILTTNASAPSTESEVFLAEPDSRIEFDGGDPPFIQGDSDFVRVVPDEVPNGDRAGNSFPAVDTVPRPTPFEAVPLDGATFEDEIALEESGKKTAAQGRTSLGWIAGANNQLGMLELDFDSLSRVQYDPVRTDQTFVDLSYGAKWLNGPNTTDLPPYLFNILIDVGGSFQFNDRLRVDAMISPGWYTDFSNKGVESFRLPWQIVSYYRMDSYWYWVMGVTDLSRHDIRYLPVIGTVYAPPNGNVRLDLVFPKPKVAYRVRQNSIRDGIWLTLNGELGGGSWAISRADRAYDVVTLRDYRLLAGVESKALKGHATRLELGWIFGRAVEYDSHVGNYNPSDSFIVRVSADY